ncbi:MAG: maleylpyruvate isomerase N-terminal domain-containing protein [Acidimicrobiales bacterium]|jgi:maleylpyruvate isomerase
MSESEQARSDLASIEREIEGSRQATARLLATLESAKDLDASRDSQLSGWTIGHVLTHIARNADSFVWILRSAAQDLKVPQYPGGPAQRSRDIDEGATRPAAAIVEDVRESACRLDETFSAVGPDAWHRHWLRPDGSEVPGRLLPVARWREVEVHHADLGLGYRTSDWPEAFVSADLPNALERLPGMIDDPTQRAALLAWIYGRAGIPAGVDLKPF